jgi:hypothetical protein
MIAIGRSTHQPLPRPVDAVGESRPAMQKKPLVPDSRNRATEIAAHSVTKQLTKDQKAALAIIAAKAYKKHAAVNEGLSKINDWRAEESIKACGRRISEAEQRHFSLIKSHFANIAGEAGKAFNSAMRAGTEDVRIARAVLVKECAKAGLELSYPGAICFNQFKRSLEDATAKQLWCLVFTVRNRSKTGRQKAQEQKPAPKGRDYVLKPNASKPQAAEAADEPDPF